MIENSAAQFDEEAPDRLPDGLADDLDRMRHLNDAVPASSLHSSEFTGLLILLSLVVSGVKRVTQLGAVAIRAVRNAGSESTAGDAGWQASDEWLLPTPAARHLVGVVVHFLPPGSRARWLEEFRGELLDLAAVGVPPWEQLIYAVRLLSRIRQLRRVVTR